MFSITEHIEYLTTEHDCVVVPGFGAFIAQYVHAQFDFEKGTMTPPQRVLSFNVAVCHNDGVLVNSVARREGVSYDAALRAVENEVANIKAGLKDGAKIQVGSIGTLAYNEDQTSLVFAPNDRSLMRDGYFALSSITLPLASREAEVEEEKQSWIARYPFVRVAASVVVLILMSLFLSTPVSVDEMSMPEMASMSVVNTAQPQLVVEGELNIAIPNAADAVAIADTVKHNNRIETIVGTADDNAKYYLIVSSHNTREEAERYVAQDESGKLNVMEKGSKCRVYIAASNDFDEINNLRKSMSGENPDVWICVK